MSWDKSPPPATTKARNLSVILSQIMHGENCRYGIDVSKWQGDIDFNAVRNAGCSFVLMRIGSGADSISKDQYYDNNIQNATIAGLDVGVYFYSTANNEYDARFQADWIAE